MKLQPISDILRRAQLLPTLGLRAKYITGHIASEKGDNIHRTSVRIRELEAALRDIQLRRLRRERTAA
jgi:hypothetical protein